MSNKLSLLHESILEICPIEGVSSDGRIDYKSGATDEQKEAAQEIMNSFLVNPESWNPPKTATQAVTEGEAFLDSIGWTDRNQKLAMGGVRRMDAAILEKYDATYSAIVAMYQAAKSNPETFVAANFPIPHLPGEFGL